MTSQTQRRSYQPTTFLERGAFVPFTTPMLAGARVRPAARAGMELLVRNPAGGRGTYIIPWDGLHEVCRPTVHDSQLAERVAALRSVTPATIRRAGREIASAGFAGRAAGHAAQSALAGEQSGLVVTNFMLLLRLVQQEEPQGSVQGSAVPPERENPADLERRAKRTIAALAPRLTLAAETIGAALEQLAELFEPIGLGLPTGAAAGAASSPARLPHALGLLKLLRQDALALPTQADEMAPHLIEMLVATADVSIAGAERALADARAAAGDITRLITDWQADPAALSRMLARAEWLMDGWERICQLWWLDPSPAARRDVLHEIADLLPIIPREVGEWVGFHLDIEAPVRLRRLVLGHEDWRTGLCVQDTIARNEALLAA